MIFAIQTKDKDGNITFTGTATKEQASFLMNIGTNYLLQKGVEPMLTGGSDNKAVEGTDTVQ